MVCINTGENNEHTQKCEVYEEENVEGEGDHINMRITNGTNLRIREKRINPFQSVKSVLSVFY